MPELTLTAQNALPQGEVAEIAGTMIKVMPMRRLTTLMPARGGEEALKACLAETHGIALPACNMSSRQGDDTAETGECLSFGHRQYLLVGCAPDERLSVVATMTDQTDAWSTVVLQGKLARDVLARLCPLDLRPAIFPVGATARSEIKHMLASVTRIGEDSYRLMVFRSMAQTLLHDLREALEGRAARENLQA